MAEVRKGEPVVRSQRPPAFRRLIHFCRRTIPAPREENILAIPRLARKIASMATTPLADAPKPTKPRWYAPTPAKFLFAVLVMQGVLFLSAHYRWFWFNERKGYTVLITVGATVVALVVLVATVLMSRFFRTKSQFSLATLLLMVPVMGIPCAWLSREMELARRQREAIAVVEARGGICEFEHYRRRPRSSKVPPLAPEWLDYLFGPNLFDDVTTVELGGAQTTELELIERFGHLRRLNLTGFNFRDIDFQRLKEFKELTELEFAGTQFSDTHLEQLGQLQGLRVLWLKSPRIRDEGLAHLSKLTSLESLGLFKSDITDNGLKHLAGLNRLQILAVESTQVTDAGLIHFRGLKAMEEVRFLRTQVTDAGESLLKEALPKCDIVNIPDYPSDL